MCFRGDGMKFNAIFSVTKSEYMLLSMFGNKGDLVSRSSKDLKQFKEKTKDSILIMGRKTYESLGSKDLPGRKSIVVSSQGNIKSLDMAISRAKEIGSKSDNCFVIGGASLIEDGIRRELFDTIYKTVFVNSATQADVYFDMCCFIGTEYGLEESVYEKEHYQANGVDYYGSVGYLTFIKVLNEKENCYI